MRRSLTVLLAALALPALADTPPAAAEAAPLEKEAAPFSNWPSRLQMLELFGAPKERRLAPPEMERIPKEFTFLPEAVRPQRNCYFIRQVNQNLQKPKEEPELVPLQDAAAAPIRNDDMSCLTDSIVRGSVAK